MMVTGDDEDDDKANDMGMTTTMTTTIAMARQATGYDDRTMTARLMVKARR